MCVASSPLVEDSGLVERVNPHLSRSVKYFPVVAHNPDMDDGPLAVLEEGQIAGARLINEIDKLTQFGLLGGVTRKAYADTLISELCQS